MVLDGIAMKLTVTDRVHVPRGPPDHEYYVRLVDEQLNLDHEETEVDEESGLTQDIITRVSRVEP